MERIPIRIAANEARHDMETRRHNPSIGIYAATPDYIHALEVRNPSRFLYLSGTMGLGENGAAGKTLAEQFDLIWANLRTILRSADMTVANAVRITSYLRDPSCAEENQQARIAALQDHVVPITAIVAQTLVAQTLVDDWLVEIEIVAAA
jgi:enamine deaminase RidA (YjgF/YER057c/UK114 family)